MNSLISQQGTTVLYPATVTVTLPRYYFKVFQLQVATSLGDYEADNLNLGIDIIFFPYSITGMSFDIQIYTFSAQNIIKLSINYLISDFPVNDPNARLYFIPIYEPTLLKNDPLYDYKAQFTISQLNITGGARQVSLITGLKAYPTSSVSLVFNIAIDVQIKNETYIIVQLTSSSEEFTYLEQLLITVLLYNDGYMTQSVYYRLYDDSFVVSNSNFVSYQSYIRQIAKCNTIFGINALAISNNNRINILSDIGQSNNIEINSDYILEYLKISFISVYSQYCDYKNPYYESTTGVCYSTCPQKTQKQQQMLACVCYAQDGYTLLANNSCLVLSNNLSGQETSSNTIIISVTIGSIIFFIASILGIYCFCKKRQIKNLYQISDKNPNGLRVQISFEDSPSKNTMSVIKSIDSKLDKPQFYSIFQLKANQNLTDKESSSQIKKQTQKKQHQKQIRLPQAKEQSIQKVQWTDCNDKYNSQERCCICIKMNAFLKTKCSHYFHAKCMLDYLQKQFHVCPLCQQILQKQAEYYCVSCFKKYRQINLDSLKEARIKLDQLQTKCQQCREIPK